MTYIIKNGNWVYSNGHTSTTLGVCISLDRPSLYTALGEELNIPRLDESIKDEVITLLKHGNVEFVRNYYLYLVDSPLRQYCTFYFIELSAKETNAKNLNKIIDTSCLSKKYLDKLISENNNASPTV
jgi:hypothetical protein